MAEQKYASRQKIVEFNNLVRDLGKFSIDRKDKNVLDTVKTHCDEYRMLCSEYDMTPTWEGMALALGKNRHVLTQWRDGTVQWVKEKGISEYLQSEWAWINSILISSMTDGKIDRVTGIFVARNNFGYVNEDAPIKKQEISVKLSMDQLIAGAKNLETVAVQAEQGMIPANTSKVKKDAALKEREPARPIKQIQSKKEREKPDFLDDVW